MSVFNFGDKLFSLIQDAKYLKENANDSESARSWAIIRTDLEKVFAYHEAYLKPKPVEDVKPNLGDS